MTTLLSSLVANEAHSLQLHDFVLNNLRYETLHKFTHTLPKLQYHDSGTEGFQQAEILVSTKCDLTTFIGIVQPLLSAASNDSSENMRFNPSISAFREPSRATGTLSVDFTDLVPMLKWLRVHDNADSMNMKTKRTVRSQVAMLRVLGTSCLLTDPSESQPTQPQVDCFLPFQSCTSFQVQHLHQIFTNKREGTASEVGNGVHVHETVQDKGATDAQQQQNVQHDDLKQQPKFLYRRRQDFDDDQGRFLSPWRMKYSQSNPFCKETSGETADTSKIDTSESFDCCFTLQWTSSKPLSKTVWTTDATFTGSHVLGDVTLFFPCTTFIGNSTVTEIETLLTQVP